MMSRFFSKVHPDSVGFAASMACAVHCGMLPFILTFSALSGWRWLAEPWIEIGFIILSFVIALIAIGRNFGRHKHILLAIKVITAGFAVILLSRFMEHGTAEHMVTAAGGVLIAIGHVLNWRLARKSACCATEH